MIVFQISVIFRFKVFLFCCLYLLITGRNWVASIQSYLFHLQILLLNFVWFNFRLFKPLCEIPIERSKNVILS